MKLSTHKEKIIPCGVIKGGWFLRGNPRGTCKAKEAHSLLPRRPCLQSERPGNYTGACINLPGPFPTGPVEHCCRLVAQSCPALCDPMHCSPPGSSIYGIFQARILEWDAISSFRWSSQLSDWILLSCTGGGFFATDPPRKAWLLIESLKYLPGGPPQGVAGVLSHVGWLS